MFRLIRKILGLCQHKWETFHHTEVKYTYSQRTYAYVYYQKCKHCGKLKRVRFDN